MPWCPLLPSLTLCVTRRGREGWAWPTSQRSWRGPHTYTVGSTGWGAKRWDNIPHTYHIPCHTMYHAKYGLGWAARRWENETAYDKPCHTTYHAIPHSMPYHIPCHTTFHAIPQTMPYHIPCHTTFHGIPHNMPYHLSYHAIPPL